MNTTLLKTGRLILRELEENDLPGIYEYAQDFEVFRYQEYGPFNENETKLHLQTMISFQKENPRAHYELAVILKANSQVIGNAGIQISSPSNREGWIDCSLNRKFWNRGYATEITLALLELGFKELKLHRIFATCAPANLGSERVLTKVGLKPEGCLRGHNLVRGQWQDALVYAMLEEEWASQTKT